MSLINALSGSRLVRATQYTQDNVVLNKALLVILGVDVPLVGLSRNQQEMKETLFRAALILASAYLIAPFRAKAIAWGLSKLFKFDSRLMKLPFESLKSGEQFKNGVAVLAKELKIPIVLPRETSKTLKHVVEAKSQLLIWDLILDGLVFVNMGWIKNAFGRFITGKKQFTGEMGVVSQEKLDKLYALKNQKKTPLEKYLPWITSSMAIVSPLILGLWVRRAMLSPVKQMGKVTGFLRKHVTQFDYKSGIYMKLAPLFLVGVLNDVGDIIAARSNHERREIFLKKVPITGLFFFGDMAWMWVASKFVLAKHKIPAVTSIAKAVELAPKHLKTKAAASAAGLYWLSFILNTLCLGGVVIANNRLTTKKVKEEVAHMDTMTNKTRPRKYLNWPQTQPDDWARFNLNKRPAHAVALF